MPQRNTIEVIISARDDASQVFDRVASGLDSAGSRLQATGLGIASVFAPAVAGLGAATNAAMAFEESITNISSVTGTVGDDLAALSDQILAIGEDSRYGPQAVADAFTDIAGGVTDASVRMDVLEAAVRAAQAGNADLAGTTSALIGIMNSYQLSAEGAAFASDVLTQTVGMGVGTMDQFGAALPQVTGLANSLSIGFDELGAMAAYLTTQGNTASGSVTQLGAMMSALLNPNERMKEGIAALGFESGRAAVEALGLIGVYQGLTDQFGQDAIAPMVGQLEALRGVTALAGGEFEEFSQQFIDGLEGATAAAEAIQMESAAAQMDLLRSKIQTVGISVGEALLPALNRLVDGIMPVIDSVIDWVQANPDLVASIAGLVTAGAALGTTIGVVGTALRGLGTVVKVAGLAFGALTSPIGLVVAGGALLAQVLGVDVLGGLRAIGEQAGVFMARVGEQGLAGALQSMFTTFEDGSSTIGDILEGFGMAEQDARSLANTINSSVQKFSRFFAALGAGVPVGDALQELLLELLPRDVALGIIDGVERIGEVIRTAFDAAVGFIQNTVLPALQTLADWFMQDAMPAVIDFVQGTVVPGLESFFNFLGDAWESVRPGLERLWQWFTVEALPAVVGFVENVVLPGIQRFVDFLGTVWETVRPGLEELGRWFVEDALPGVVTFIEQTVLPGVQKFIDLIVGIWEAVEPGLSTLAEWFVETGLPLIQDFIQDTIDNFIEPLINILEGIWNAVRPALEDIFDWFVTEGLPAIGTAIDDVLNNFVLPLIETLADWWSTISDGVGQVLDWFTVNGIPLIESAVGSLMDNFIRPLLDLLVSIWTNVGPALEEFRAGIEAVFGWISDNVIQPIKNLIDDFITTLQNLGLIASTTADTLAGGTPNYIAPEPDPLGRTYKGQIPRDMLPYLPHMPGRDMGGMGVPGQAYMIGTGAQPEVFVPRSAGQFIPNADRLGGVSIGDGAVVVNVYGGNPEEVKQAVFEALVELAEEN